MKIKTKDEREYPSNPYLPPTSAGMEAWDMAPGMEMRLFTLPKLTVILKSFVT